MGLGLLKLVSPTGWLFVALGIAFAALFGLQVGKTRHWHNQSVKYEKLYDEQLIAFQKTIINYRTAADKARADDAANKARVEAEQTAINQKRDATYEARIADARARADRLRQQLDAARRHPGSSGKPAVPSVSPAPSGPNQAAGEDGLSDALIATEQAIQLDELIKWVHGQHQVDVNNDAHPTH